MFMVLASEPGNTVRKVEQFIKSDIDNSEPVMKGIRFKIINIANLNIKAIQHSKEETKSDLVRDITFDMLQKYSVSCDGVETQFVAGDLTQVDLEDHIQSDGSRIHANNKPNGSY